MAFLSAEVSIVSPHLPPYPIASLKRMWLEVAAVCAARNPMQSSATAFSEKTRLDWAVDSLQNSVEIPGCCIADFLRTGLIWEAESALQLLMKSMLKVAGLRITRQR